MKEKWVASPITQEQEWRKEGDGFYAYCTSCKSWCINGNWISVIQLFENRTTDEVKQLMGKVNNYPPICPRCTKDFSGKIQEQQKKETDIREKCMQWLQENDSSDDSYML